MIILMEHVVHATPNARLWVRTTGDPDAPALLLVMGANAPGVTWPEELVNRLAKEHYVISYDHRDTGRSTHAFDTEPYAIRDLAGDAVVVLDALNVDRAHVVGMSMGGVLVQILCLDYPERLRTATMLNTTALGSGLASGNEALEQPGLPGPAPELLALWEHMAEPRERADEIAWRVEHWRLLNGSVLPFDAAAFRRLEERVVEHSGTHRNPGAHARAAQDGLERGAELASVSTPALVVEGPEDPINPPPHSAHLARSIPGARLATIPGMGHALNPLIVPLLVEEILSHTTGTTL
ncbi:pimeloyl-ACP methyl ester carboxylesterase [Lipingzhangella halophila]|uniref:Pimeloyl-ACP methyl ester carboxylesterase n=1 Tax=Lipingzhangella halophila TaxID=1783352 RepID=A0A7W7RMV6_9ACTN|nr:alpha/beta hydrolase [Lipingzhangella halophila]MBB4934862.1 pimeloyl-ACP methyl ester carboxylesterase [Lipingzhangella halophila]